MRILLYYGTTEGQTRRIVEAIADQLRAGGDDPLIVEASAAPPPSLQDCGAVVIAASLHGGRYQAAVADGTKAIAPLLTKTPSLFVSVSLTAASHDPEELAELAACTEEFLKATLWCPTQIAQVAGAFRFSQYDFFKRWIMRRIAREKAVSIKPGEDYELTDWAQLAHEVAAFRAKAGGAT